MIVTGRISTLLYTTILTLAVHGAAKAAFDPQDSTEKTLPDTRALYQRGVLNPMDGTEKVASAPNRSTRGYVAARGLPHNSAPLPFYPTRTIMMPSAPATAAAFPPVDANVAAKAQAQLAQTPTVVPVATSAMPVTGFVAPAPLMAMTPPPPSPAATANAPMVVMPKTTVAAPVTVAAVATPEITMPSQPLSSQSKDILSRVPSKLDQANQSKSTKLQLERVSPDIEAVLGKDAAEQKYESVGLSIKVRRPGLDANNELNRAYTALMGGDTPAAVQIYKDILSTQPTNQDALFGLAATYHRQGDLNHARPLYGSLLKLNPNHREGLNNFLALISDESPQEALAELERLEQRNPDFSPIPAQQAIVLDKLGYTNESRAKMLRAIDLAPENMSYKYNLAVMSDRNGNFADASALYRLLIDAGLQGEPLPAPVADLQKRLNFITSTAAANGKAVGG